MLILLLAHANFELKLFDIVLSGICTSLSILSQDNALERKDTGSLLYGERHGMCKIDVRTAQAIYMASGPKAAIGKVFGVSRYSVSNIKSGSNWRRATRGLKKGQTREGRVRLHLIPSRK
jgi:hypothetical protein